MGKLKLFVSSLLGLWTIQASAQYAQDALRFSETNWLIGSSARMQGIAGAQTSLGADISLAGTNPAGLGFYNRSSSAVSLGLDFQNSDDTFGFDAERFTTPNFRNVLGIRNAGAVMNYNTGRFSEEKFKGGSLGITFTKVNDFNREYRYEGASNTSLLDAALENANAGGWGGVEEAFFQHFMIDEIYFFDSDPPGTSYFNESGGVISPSQSGDLVEWSSPISGLPYQQEHISQRGGQHQINISWGGNYDDKFYFGGGLGIQTLYYQRKRSYSESEFLGSDGFLDPYFNGFELEDKVIARGGGLNATAGVILRPVQALTIGASYRSPTYLTINEEFSQDFTSDWENFSYEDLNGNGDVFPLQNQEAYLSPIYETKYKIKTPARLNLGATVFLGKTGFITADIERVDYSSAKLQSQDFASLGFNQEILNFESVTNYRVGAEMRMDELRLRGGVGHDQDPTGLGNDRDHVTFGFGVKTSDYFVDLAVVTSKYNRFYAPYTLSQGTLDAFGVDNPIVDSSITNTTVTLSAGFNF